MYIYKIYSLLGITHLPQNECPHWAVTASTKTPEQRAHVRSESSHILTLSSDLGDTDCRQRAGCINDEVKRQRANASAASLIANEENAFPDTRDCFVAVILYFPTRLFIHLIYQSLFQISNFFKIFTKIITDPSQLFNTINFITMQVILMKV